MKLAGLNVKFYHDTVKKMTICEVAKPHKLTLKKETIIGVGEARCNTHDTFCKAAGRKLAMGRALEHLGRPIRTQIWDEYKQQAKL